MSALGLQKRLRAALSELYRGDVPKQWRKWSPTGKALEQAVDSLETNNATAAFFRSQPKEVVKALEDRVGVSLDPAAVVSVNNRSGTGCPPESTSCSEMS